MGNDAFGFQKDFWEYNPDADTWTPKANFGGTDRLFAVGFSIGGKGYLGTGLDYYEGYKKDFWEYDPDINSWTQKADFGGIARYSAVGFSISNKGYLGTGFSGTLISTFGPSKDFWEYTPDFGVETSFINNGESALSVFPNPSNGAFINYLKLNVELNAEVTLEVLNMLGEKVYSQQVQLVKGVLQKEIQLDEANIDGMYLVKVIINDQLFTAQINMQN
ncbi:MAG: T9SS type A sorting domain-containing protein [Chitinophagales bacterium]